MERISAVVVTFNRLELVKKTISALQCQTRPLDCIIIVNNGSTDGTADYLDSLPKENEWIIIHQENVGGSGGFWRGIKEAYERGFDWIWCMDDDVFPRENCLEEALECTDQRTGIVCPKRIMNGKTFISESETLNLSNIFQWRYGKVLSCKAANGRIPIDLQSMTFEGPLIRREVVDKIGLPNRELFILFDDTDYSYRTHLAGFRILYSPLAVIDKHFFKQTKTADELFLANKWKMWYDIRNASYFAKQYGKNWLYRTIGEFPFLYMLSILKNIFLNKHYDFQDIYKAYTMYKKGRNGKLGKIND